METKIEHLCGKLPNGNFINNIIKDINETGEEVKQQFKELSEKAQKRIDSKVNCAKFEAIYALTVSKKERKQTMKEVKEVRSDLWKEALKKAKGDTKTAYAFYKESCSFP